MFTTSFRFIWILVIFSYVLHLILLFYLFDLLNSHIFLPICTKMVPLVTSEVSLATLESRRFDGRSRAGDVGVGGRLMGMYTMCAMCQIVFNILLFTFEIRISHWDQILRQWNASSTCLFSSPLFSFLFSSFVII